MKPVRWLPYLGFVACLCCLLSPALAQQTPRRLPILPQTGPLAGQTVYTNSFALLVGINRYQNLPEANWLEFARKDVLSLRETLVRSYGFPSENIITLLDQQATKENIQNALTYLTDKKRVQPTDRLLIYFSCHGQAIDTQTGGKEGFLIPYDAQIDLKGGANRLSYARYALPMAQLWSYVEAGGARHCTIIADACFGGLLARAKGNHLGNVTLQKLLSAPAYQVLSAGGRNEEAWEDASLGHSVLMYSLLKELHQRAEEVDATFSLTDLFGSVRDEVIEKSAGRQKPLLQSYAATEGDMVFVTTSAQYVPPLVSGFPSSRPVPTRTDTTARARAEALVEAANEKLNRKSDKEAEQLYRQAIAVDPDCADAYYDLGLFCFSKTDYIEAEKCFKKVIELSPQAPGSYYNLALTFQSKKDDGKAEQYYKKTIAIDPKYYAAYHNLSNVYEDRKDYFEAERCLKKVIELDPNHAHNYMNLGRLNYYFKEDYVEAARLYKKAIELEPNNADAHADLVQSHRNWVWNSFCSLESNLMCSIGTYPYRGKPTCLSLEAEFQTLFAGTCT